MVPAGKVSQTSANMFELWVYILYPLTFGLNISFDCTFQDLSNKVNIIFLIKSV